jgi:3-oxoacyl-[acyl-carrier protein] reductase
VTGVSSGIGKATAIRFLEEGADLAVNEFKNPVTEVVRKGRDLERGVVSLRADVRKTRDVNTLVKKALEKFGRIDVLFANAGILSWARTEDLTDEEWDYVVDCDLKGTFRLCRSVIPVMKKQKYGRIIINSSISGSKTGWIGHAHYCAAKAGLIGLTRALAVELAKYGLTVNAISPGIIVSEQSKSKASVGERGLTRMGKYIPAGYVGLPEDVASTAVFLASEESRYITGQNLIVDGGFTLQEDIAPVGNPPPPAGYIQRYDRIFRTSESRI